MSYLEDAAKAAGQWAGRDAKQFERGAEATANGINNFVRGAANSATFGLADKAEALFESEINGKSYAENLKVQKALDAAGAHSGYEYDMGAVAGALVPAGGIVKAGAIVAREAGIAVMGAIPESVVGNMMRDGMTEGEVGLMGLGVMQTVKGAVANAATGLAGLVAGGAATGNIMEASAHEIAPASTPLAGDEGKKERVR